MTDDLRKLTEAAKAIQTVMKLPPDHYEDRSIREFRRAASPDAIIALYRERDEARADYLRRHNEAVDHFQARIAAEAALSAAREEVERYKIALADATRRPMGVLPASAEGLVTAADMDAAEARRTRHGADPCALNPDTLRYGNKRSKPKDHTHD